MRFAVPIVVLAATLAGCTGGDEASAPHVSADAACANAVVNGPLPEWARTGFTPPDQDVRHVVGERGDIAGVLFGYPMQAPPGTERGNKILWVGRVLDGDPHDLVIHGSSDSGATMSASVAGGPGPSIIDVPGPGCWTFDVTWGSHSDRVSVPYSKPE